MTENEQWHLLNAKRMEIAKALFSPQNWQAERNAQQLLRLVGELIAIAGTKATEEA